MSYSKKISDFIIEKVLPMKFKVWLLDRLACDIANQGEEGDTELAHINSYEAKLLRSVGGSGTINKTTGLKQYKGGGGGSPAPASTQTVVEKAEFPPELRPYITDILEKAQAQEQVRLAAGYPVYDVGPRIAPFTPEELAAQAGIASLVGSSTPTFDIAKGLTASGTGEATPEDIGRRMSPFMQQVVDIEKREAQRAAAPRRQQLAAQGVAAGGFGGTREALMQAELDRNLQQQLGDIQARGQQAAFQQAQEAFERQKQRQLAGGQQFAAMAPVQSSLQFKELGALAGVGEQQRQQQQKALDLAFQQFREEQTFPEASLQQYQSIIRGFPLQPTTTQTQQSILPTPSLGQQLIGLGTGALGLAGAARTLFKEGGPLKPIPEDNKGLPNLPEAVRNKMGFMKSGGSFPDLSGDGKVTQKDILMGRGVIKKKKGKRISKKQNNMYKEMLYAMLSDGKRKDINGDISEIADIMKEKGISTLSKDGGVVKLQPGGQVLDFLKPIDFTTTNAEPVLRGIASAQIQGAGVPYEEQTKSVQDRIKELQGLTVRSQDEIDKEREEDERMDKFKAFMQLAQFGGNVLSADPSRGTLAALGKSVSEAAPGFTEVAEQKRKREKDERARQLAEQATVLDLDIKSLGLTKDVKAEKDKAIDKTTDIMKTIYAADKSTEDALIKANKDTRLKNKDLISILNSSGDDLIKSADNKFGFGINKEGVRISLDKSLDPAKEERNIKSKQLATLANALLKKNFLEIDDGKLSREDMKTQQQAELEAEMILSAAYNQKAGLDPNAGTAELYKFITLAELGRGRKAKAYKSNVMGNQDFEKVLEAYGLLF